MRVPLARRGPRRRPRLAACACPALGAPPPPPGPSAADLASAKKLFQTGLKLYNEGSYREALASFRKAYDIAPRASLQRNIAQCHRDLKDFASAYDAYRLLLAKYGGTMTVPDRRAIERAIDGRDAHRQHPRHRDRAGATVSVDDHEAGTIPLTGPLRASLGPHVVTVTKPASSPSAGT